MKAVGLITEYNPFHNGHIYHLRKAREITGANVVVVVMSGNFTQRGEPTILNKWQRTQAALENGADLVIELPTFMAVQPAHRFADGAIRLLAALQVPSIVFGAEHPDWDFDQFVQAEAHFMKDGFARYNATFATQFNQELKQATGHTLTEPNDILAFAYHKAIVKQRVGIKPVAIARQGSQYHDQSITGTIASASAIRQAVLGGRPVDQVVPKQTANDLSHLDSIPDWQILYPLLRNYLIQAPIGELQTIYQMTEGLEHRMKRAAQQSLTFNQFIRQLKTKRYTYSHLLRLCFYTVMQMREDQVQMYLQQPYLRILGFSNDGRQYLHTIKKRVSLPLITKCGQAERDHLLNLDYRAGKLYQLFTPYEQDLKRAPVMISGSGTVKE
ncbi:nucleotidyltransferase [Limosilactobacillus frumenti]|uniref:nucleotidyltransferase n=1 Tax=Limosilactobacillus frumenti TaxID=104955 RepID=UPI0015EB8A4A|nr:nucleotidyltransferase [Limosilactobacillus frumenti]MBA2913324.1 nucleotidyltransferase [Limosilactobacillus frumenti]